MDKANPGGNAWLLTVPGISGGADTGGMPAGAALSGGVDVHVLTVRTDTQVPFTDSLYPEGPGSFTASRQAKVLQTFMHKWLAQASHNAVARIPPSTRVGPGDPRNCRLF